MKDKEKQIEEMANCFNCVCKPVCMKTADINKEQELLSWNEYIKQYGCKHYQPKLPEDSVVLSKEEYENIYEQAEQNVLANIADGGTSCHRCIEQHEKKASKETAEKFIKECKKYKVKKFSPIGISQRDTGVLWIEMPEWKFDELAKQFGVEIKE